MKLVSCKCPDCGGVLSNVSPNTVVSCEYCGSSFYADGQNSYNVVHSIKDPKTLGYNFEQGRIAAQQEAFAERQRQLSEQEAEYKKKKSRQLLIKVLLWVFLFPVMSIIYIAKSPKISREIKVFLIFVIFVVVMRLILG